jgi:hypothetical protein
MPPITIVREIIAPTSVTAMDLFVHERTNNEANDLHARELL